MTDIKMSEVFDLPLHRDKFGGVIDNEAGMLLRVSEEIDYIGNHMLVAKIEDAAAHAINNHDRLVAENEALRDALDNLLSELSLKYGIRLDNVIGAGMRDAVERSHKALGK